jgi:hypothetical protein
MSSAIASASDHAAPTPGQRLYLPEYDQVPFREPTRGYLILAPQRTGSTYLPCAFVGLGFCAFRHGILEDPRPRYPYFYSPVQSIRTGRADVPEYRALSSEDASLFHNLIEAGIISSIMLKTDLRVGHEKTAII